MTRGYSLIELIVVVSILLILSAGVMVGYTNYNQNQQVRQAGLDLKTAFNLARSKALSGERPPAITCDALDGYDVTWDSGSYTYNVEASCDIGSSRQTVFTHTIPSKFVITGMGTSIRFLPLTQGVSPAGAHIVTISLGTVVYSFTVNQNGSILEN
jgi:prepilin-type N-terminal cleavage/methylation domain-containing protein